VKITEWSCSYSSGYTEFTGEVRNTSSVRTVRYVKLRGNIKDGNNKVVNTDWAFIDSDEVGPGNTSSFSFLIENPKGVRRCDLTVLDADFSND
jgi:hypothetical protein